MLVFFITQNSRIPIESDICASSIHISRGQPYSVEVKLCMLHRETNEPHMRIDQTICVANVLKKIIDFQKSIQFLAH